MLVVDGANVVGSAARTAGGRTGRARRGGCTSGCWSPTLSYDVVVLVLEGAAKGGVPAGGTGTCVTVHAPRDGDSDDHGGGPAPRGERGDAVTVVTADRLLQSAVQAVGRRPSHEPVLAPRPALTRR